MISKEKERWIMGVWDRSATGFAKPLGAAASCSLDGAAHMCTDIEKLRALEEILERLRTQRDYYEREIVRSQEKITELDEALPKADAEFREALRAFKSS